MNWYCLFTITNGKLKNTGNNCPKKAAKAIIHDEFKHAVYAFLLRDEFVTQQKIESNLNENDIVRLKSIKEFKGNNKVSKSNKEYLKSLEKEIDLHIEELVDSYKHLTNGQILITFSCHLI